MNIKLTELQLKKLTEVVNKRAQMQGILNMLTDQENTLISIIVDSNNIKTEDVKDVKLEGDSLVIEMK
jgi:hypothetical protein